MLFRKTLQNMKFIMGHSDPRLTRSLSHYTTKLVLIIRLSPEMSRTQCVTLCLTHAVIRELLVQSQFDLWQNISPAIDAHTSLNKVYTKSAETHILLELQKTRLAANHYECHTVQNTWISQSGLWIHVVKRITQCQPDSTRISQSLFHPSIASIDWLCKRPRTRRQHTVVHSQLQNLHLKPSFAALCLLK